MNLPLLVLAGDEDEVPAGLVDGFNVSGLVHVPFVPTEFQALVRKSLRKG
jgi:hypothetical protein